MEDNFLTEEELRSIRKITIEELNELHDKIRRAMGELKELGGTGASGPEDLAILFHTITGTAAIAGFEQISKIASTVETMLKDRDELPPDMADNLKKLFKALGERLAVVKP